MPRSFCLLVLFLALLLLLLPFAALAGDKPPTPAPELYKRAVAHLDEGRWFEADIADLTEAARQDPKNSDYHLALGCAEVDRAGSLAYAAFITDLRLNAQAQYVKDFAAWQAAQQNTKAGDYGKPAPIPPPSSWRPFQTKDDLKYLRLTGKQAAAQALALGRAAQVEWVQAVRLAKTPQARAQAESVGGWGLQYERKLLQYTSTSSPFEPYTGNTNYQVPGAPKPLDPALAFQAATKDDPSSAAYWEALGDAYPYNGYDDTSHAPDIIHAWQKSLALAPGNTALRFRLYEVQAKSDPKAALETLKALAALDPRNSLLQYGLAALLFKQVHYSDVHDRVDPATINSNQPTTKAEDDAWRNTVAQDLAAKDNAASEQVASEAIDAMERGNAGDHYDVPDYTPPVPKVLWRAWDYCHNIAQLNEPSSLLMFSANQRELARAAGGYSIVATRLGNEANAARADRACIGMGMKMVGDWPIHDEMPGGVTLQALIGLAIVGIGYADLQRVYEQTGNAARLQATAAEYEAFQQKQKAYRAALAQALEEFMATAQAYLFNNY